MFALKALYLCTGALEIFAMFILVPQDGLTIMNVAGQGVKNL